MNRVCVGLAFGLLAVAVFGFVAGASEPVVIFHNGTIVPMTSPDASYTAMLVRGALIERLGTDDEIRALAGDDATVIDLDGRAVYPGFIDPHTHLLGHATMNDMTMAEAERMALGYGLTHVADMHIGSSDLQSLRAYATGHGLTIRVSMYLLYNDACGSVHGTWYERYSAGSEVAPRLYVGGVKVFSETSACGDLPLGLSFGPALKPGLSERGQERFGHTRPLFTPQEMAAVFERIDRAGYQIAVHALGDGGVTTTLDAYELLLDGGTNTNRHMLLHNWFVSDESVARYAELGIGASIEVSTPCYIERWTTYLLPEVRDAVFRYAGLVETGAHIAASSDWPWVGEQSLDPMYKLSILATGDSDVDDIFADGASCGPIDASRRVTVWQALRMMTVEAAYLLKVDDLSGALEPGKRADLVILSADPLQTPLSDLASIEVQSTYIDGELVWEKGSE